MKSANPSSRWVVFLSLGMVAASSLAQDPSGEAMRDALAPTGTLRAAFLATNPMQAKVNPQTKEVTGPVADISRELGLRMGVPVSFQPIAGVPSVIDAVNGGAVDIGFLAYDATRAEQVAFSQAYLHGHNSYIVRADSPMQSVADTDREGVRIAARVGVAVDLFLSRTLARAELVHVDRATTEEDATRMVLAGEIDAYAANTQRLAEAAAMEPRIRVLNGSLMSAEQSIAVLKGNDVAVAHLNRFIDDMRASGLLHEIVARSGLSGVEVAPKRP